MDYVGYEKAVSTCLGEDGCGRGGKHVLRTWKLSCTHAVRTWKACLHVWTNEWRADNVLRAGGRAATIHNNTDNTAETRGGLLT